MDKDDNDYQDVTDWTEEELKTIFQKVDLDKSGVISRIVRKHSSKIV